MMTLQTGIQKKPNKPLHYFGRLGLARDPFTTSPDPSYFYPAAQYTSCLAQLEISLRLKRGACVVFGEIGTGKTTLCRSLIQRFDKDPEMELSLLLNPPAEPETQFLVQLARLFSLSCSEGNASACIKDYLFSKTVEEGKTVVLVIDEAQKISLEAVEALRTLLNYETNEFKMLQLILFGQLELRDKIMRMPNFQDRINYRTELKPLSLEECRELICFRLSKAGCRPKNMPFREDAFKAIHALTQGYPRKVCLLTHRLLMEMIMQNRREADEEFILQTMKGYCSWE